MHCVRLSSLLALILFFSALGFGQSFSTITGLVTDQVGAVIPGVEVTITNITTGVSRTVTTNDIGAYRATQLPPGTYNVKTEAEGFRPRLITNVSLPIDDVVTLNLPLALGSLTDLIEVTASTEVVNTVNAQLGI